MKLSIPLKPAILLKLPIPLKWAIPLIPTFRV
jgi:hypothetical protein